ncbi:MAG: hypothetical protein M1834_006841 [Cirrosporium novae-zelandiae]|nr:MAG: hypothetical protein M1834_006841 [Cirrosporium novae-zelandiae]
MHIQLGLLAALAATYVANASPVEVEPRAAPLCTQHPIIRNSLVKCSTATDLCSTVLGRGPTTHVSTKITKTTAHGAKTTSIFKTTVTHVAGGVKTVTHTAPKVTITKTSTVTKGCAGVAKRAPEALEEAATPTTSCGLKHPSKDYLTSVCKCLYDEKTVTTVSKTISGKNSVKTVIVKATSTTTNKGKTTVVTKTPTSTVTKKVTVTSCTAQPSTTVAPPVTTEASTTSAPPADITCTAVSANGYTYNRYFSGTQLEETTANPGNDNPNEPPIVMEISGDINYACTAIQMCANTASKNGVLNDIYLSFDIHFFPASNTWECKQYYDANTNPSYFNQPNTLVSSVYGFSSSLD